MVERILVAEDIDSINQGVAHLLEKMELYDVQFAQYCDQAYLLFKKATQEGQLFSLLISDLSFKATHRERKITSGEQLITILKKEQPSLKVLVFSIEDHPQRVNDLWQTGMIDAYVSKDREGLKHLQEAITSVGNGQKYLSPTIEQALRQNNLVSLESYEVKLLNLLANGHNQDEIGQILKQEGISPNSRSSIEKRLKELRDQFGAKTTIHLITILRELRIL